ncbi:MAG: hypothetical protein K0S12_1397 [Bacteroidetes bacterium]|jgi:hypothetical protein|nr:hypothetical protein [Bacteroidota bacterium]
MCQAITCFLLLLCSQGFSQVYYAVKGNRHFYVDMNKDSAHIEVFQRFRYMIALKDEAILQFKGKSDTLFSGTKYNVTRKGNNYFLLHSPAGQKTEKIQLTPNYVSTSRGFMRKSAFLTLTKKQLTRLQDSLSGPKRSATISFLPLYKTHDTLVYAEYARVVTHIKDSLSLAIQAMKDSTVDNYYKVTTLSFRDSTKIFDLLSTADYKFYYGKYLLRHVALHQPELLVRYIDKRPANQKIILKTIRNEEDFRRLTASVKATALHTKGKKLIVRQKNARLAADASIVGLNVVIVLAEIGLIVLLVKWIASG